MEEILVCTLRFAERRPGAFEDLHADLADRLPVGPVEASPRYPCKDPRQVVLRVIKRQEPQLEALIEELSRRHHVEVCSREDSTFYWQPELGLDQHRAGDYSRGYCTDAFDD